MRSLLLISLSLYWLSPLHADDSMKTAKKEAKKIAKEQSSPLKQKLLRKEDLGFSDQDLLPDTDKGKEFDAKAADNDYKNASNIAQTSPIQGFLNKTKKGEKIEEEEKFLVDAHALIKNPESSLDIASLEVKVSPEEEKLEICQESGTYQVTFSQTLTVNATLEVKQTIQHCKGHNKVKTYKNTDIAKSKRSKKEAALKQNTELASYHVHRNGQIVSSSWTHKANVGSCQSFNTEEKVTQEAQEEDSWSTDNAEGLSLIESNPSCKLLYTQFPQGSETRVVNGKAVTRDAWSRLLFFSCEPSSESKCAKLRAQAGVLISKKCLIQNDLGECDLWEKTYDLGKSGASQHVKATFKDDEIWGLNSEFDTSYEKNTDFGSTLTTLSIFSDLENSLEKGSDFQEKVKIFKGEPLKCQKSFLSGNVFDCCKEMDGVAVNVKLASCTTEEKCLAENRNRGKCHFIGTQKAKLGTVTEHIFCCFPTKLARVVHEQGRKQLGIKWGTAEKPKCRGFSLSELQRIDFSKIDLSEVVDDIRLDKSAYEKKLKGSVEGLKTKVQAEIKTKRLECSNQPNQTEKTYEKTQESND